MQKLKHHLRENKPKFCENKANPYVSKYVSINNHKENFRINPECDTTAW